MRRRCSQSVTNPCSRRAISPRGLGEMTVRLRAGWPTARTYTSWPQCPSSLWSTASLVCSRRAEHVENVAQASPQSPEISPESRLRDRPNLAGSWAGHRTRWGHPRLGACVHSARAHDAQGLVAGPPARRPAHASLVRGNTRAGVVRWDLGRRLPPTGRHVGARALKLPLKVYRLARSAAREGRRRLVS